MSLSEVCIICLAIRGKSKVIYGGNALRRGRFTLYVAVFDRTDATKSV